MLPENEVSIELRWQTVDGQVLSIKTHVREQIQLMSATGHRQPAVSSPSQLVLEMKITYVGPVPTHNDAAVPLTFDPLSWKLAQWLLLPWETKVPIMIFSMLFLFSS